MSTNWITLSQTAGTGNQVVTVSAATNEVMSERQLRIKITTGGKTEYVFVTQDAAPVMVTRIEFTGCQFPPISYTGGTLTTSDGRYNITAYYNDGSVVPQVAATVTGNSFSSSAINASLSVVSAGTMNLTASFSGKSASTTYTVMQMGVPEGRYIEYSGTSQVNVSGNWSSTGTTNVIANSYSGGSGLIVFDNVADYIPTEAFANQTGLTWVVLPSTIDEISSDVFSGCSSLTTIGYNGTMDEFEEITKNSGWRLNSVLRYVECTDGTIDLGVSDNIIIYYAPAKLPEVTGYTGGIQLNSFTPPLASSGHTFENGVGTLTFSEPVTEIGNNAFYNSSGMTAIELPQSVHTLGGGAFANCVSLSSITKPNVMSVGTSCFYNCQSLLSITTPNVPSYCFVNCTSLREVNVLRYNGNIGAYAFSGCSSLTSVTMQSGIVRFLDYAFAGCSSLQSIRLPNTLMELGEYVFTNCTSLNHVDDWPSRLKVIMPHTFEGCTNISWINTASNDIVTKIYECAFNDCTSLSSITLSYKTTNIGNYCFGNSIATSINYTGTMSQWNSITKSNDWKTNSVISVIHCTDGDINL